MQVVDLSGASLDELCQASLDALSAARCQANPCTTFVISPQTALSKPTPEEITGRGAYVTSFYPHLSMEDPPNTGHRDFMLHVYEISSNEYPWYCHRDNASNN